MSELHERIDEFGSSVLLASTCLGKMLVASRRIGNIALEQEAALAKDKALLKAAMEAIGHIDKSLEIWIKNEERLTHTALLNEAPLHKALARSYENLRTHTSAVLRMELEGADK